jgi:uncharacterized protein
MINRWSGRLLTRGGFRQVTAFLVFFLLVYSGMNFFVFWHAKALLPDRWTVLIAAILFLALMVVSPIAVRLLEKNGSFHAAHWVAYAGYCWMGFVFLSCCGLLLAGALHLLTRVISAIFTRPLPAPASSTSTIAVFGIALALCVYGYFEARSIRVERVRLETAKLPAGMDRLKIAQISDVHLGILVREARLKLILDRVREEAPDLLVSTGDFVDGQMDHLNGLSELFREIRPRFGKFAVTGNHEFYAGLQQSLDFTRQCGFTVLRGEQRSPGDVITVAGIDFRELGSLADQTSLLATVRRDRFTLFLKHEPVVTPTSYGQFDLQLSGHVHRGQIFPFNLVTGFVYPMQNGSYQLPGGSYLHTSRGSGTWGPPMRVLSPPEVTIVELVRVVAEP